MVIPLGIIPPGKKYPPPVAENKFAEGSGK